MSRLRRRRLLALLVLLVTTVAGLLTNPDNYQTDSAAPSQPASSTSTKSPLARDVLVQLEVKGRAAKTGYARTQFGNGWLRSGSCDTRNIILARDMSDVAYVEGCKVARGKLIDPYTAHEIQFVRGPTTSPLVQIDHVVALSDAWQKGAQNLDFITRQNLANDPLNLLAVDGAANQEKSSSDAASWLPPNKSFRCQYVARQVAVKAKYHLWVTPSEKTAIENVLTKCPAQTLPLGFNED